MTTDFSTILNDRVLDVKPAGGGCVSHAFGVTATKGKFFIKQNDADFKPQFEAEIRGLQLLHESATLHIPKVVALKESGESTFLIMEQVEAGYMTPRFWELLAEGMAALHRHTQPVFGLDHPNFIGLLPQSNVHHADWITFFREERIWPQLRMGEANGIITKELFTRFEKLFLRLKNIFPAELPALLHGDFWIGNVMANLRNEPSLFDPAVYYGHREMDIAMSKLFGGFDKRFYEVYCTTYPMASGWEKRMELCNLYPLLVHANMFGAGYLSQVNAILDHWV